MWFKSYAPLILLASIVVFMGCGSGTLVKNYENSPISAPAGKKNHENIRRAIIVAGTNTGWQMREVSKSHIVATSYRSGHMAKVDINYTTETFSINYKDSSSFQYDGTNIHKTYNSWVKKLYKTIKKNLSKM